MKALTNNRVHPNVPILEVSDFAGVLKSLKTLLPCPVHDLTYKTGSFAVRIATPNDSSQIAFLLTALGHETPSEQVSAMWHSWTLDGNRAYVAAIPSGKLVGIVTIHQMRVLHRPMPVGRITALYVVEEFRKLGVGGTLVQAAEIDLADRGCGLIEVTSNDRLIAAHAFYEHLGYARTSVRLAKPLSDKRATTSSHDVTNIR